MSIFYTGKISVDHIPKNVIEKRNNSKSWKYGYDREYDVVIISRSGQIDDVIYEVEGLAIALPKKPNDEDIVNYGLPIKEQKWSRETLPKGLTDKTLNDREFADFIEKQYYKRRHGVWIYIKGQQVYLGPTYWFGLQWYRELREYPTFRVIQNELMLFWEACCADQRCYGMNYIKNRRFGASFLGLIDEVNQGTTRENELLGIISKTGTDAKRLFLRAVRAFKRLPPFFKPPTDGTTNPQSELRFQQQNRKKRLDETISEDDGLDTVILWQNTTLNAFDGDPVFRIIVDDIENVYQYATHWRPIELK